MIVNVNLMVKSLIKIKSWTKISIDMSVKIQQNIMYAIGLNLDYVSKCAFEINKYLKHFTYMKSLNDSVVTCDEIITVRWYAENCVSKFW